jgi:hypothetical protein
MIIKKPYPQPISKICPKGLLAIPDLDWVSGLQPLKLASLKSLKGMFTTLANRKYKSTLDRYLPNVPTSRDLRLDDINRLEIGILRDINVALRSGSRCRSDPILPCIAAGIHLWGGQSGRNAFVRGGGFDANLPKDSYGRLVELLMTHPKDVALPNGNWPAISEIGSQLSNIGVSFLTKHLSFWSRAIESPFHLPILDRIVFQKFVNPSRLPSWKDYVPYVEAINAERDVLAKRPGLGAITIIDMERQLFNWAGSVDALDWKR